MSYTSTAATPSASTFIPTSSSESSLPINSSSFVPINSSSYERSILPLKSSSFNFNVTNTYPTTAAPFSAPPALPNNNDVSSFPPSPLSSSSSHSSVANLKFPTTASSLSLSGTPASPLVITTSLALDVTSSLTTDFFVSTPPPASSSTKAALPVTTSASPLELHRTSLSVGAIIGAVLGGIMVVLLMLLLVRSFWYRRKSGQGSGHASSDPDPLLDATDDTDVTQMAQEIPPVLDISMATLLSIAPATPTMPALRSSTASPTLHSSCPPSSNELTLLGLSAVGDGIVSTSTGGKSSRFSDPYPARPPVIAAGIATAVPLYEGHTSDPGMRSTLPSESSVTLVSDPPPPYMAD
ncbi:hypothetical protein BKA93DRAFT_825770 [Sparassis latifolia]